VIHVDPRDGTPIYRQIIDQVKRMVMTGSLGPGEQLESVASLAARVHVNPMTVSKAYSALVDAGVLERRRGVGLFVADAVDRSTHDDREDLLDRELRGAAALLVQLGVDETEAARRLGAHMQAFRREEEKGNDHE
jgi:GntR family transcriptional regulator